MDFSILKLWEVLTEATRFILWFLTKKLIMISCSLCYTLFRINWYTPSPRTTLSSLALRTIACIYWFRRFDVTPFSIICTSSLTRWTIFNILFKSSFACFCRCWKIFDLRFLNRFDFPNIFHSHTFWWYFELATTVIDWNAFTIFILPQEIRFAIAPGWWILLRITRYTIKATCLLTSRTICQIHFIRSTWSVCACYCKEK